MDNSAEFFRKIRQQRRCNPHLGPKFAHNGIAHIQDKPPKMRFRPGQFFQHKETKTLWEIIFAYRLQDDPHEWIYVLEERQELKTPHTLLSVYCELVSGYMLGPLPERVQFKMFRTFMDAVKYWNNYYSHGSHLHTQNKTMLREYVKVSDGEIITGQKQDPPQLDCC